LKGGGDGWSAGAFKALAYCVAISGKNSDTYTIVIERVFMGGRWTKPHKLMRTLFCRVCGHEVSDDYRRGINGVHGYFNTKFCSDVCWDNHRKDRLTKKCHICQHCGIAFDTRELESSSKYCSVYCVLLARGINKVKDVFCKECGKKIKFVQIQADRPKYTGLCMECYRRHIVTISNHRHPEKCKQCGIDFITKREVQQFCGSACAKTWQNENLSVDTKNKKRNKKGLSRATRFAIFERDGFRCRYCGSGPKVNNSIILEIDHMVPVCEGGTNDPGNLVTACNVCNSGKAHFKVKLRVVNTFKKKTIVEDDKPEQIGLFG
jgi:hypothetical protein